MKKVLLFIIGLLLFSSIVIGCSSKNNNKVEHKIVIAKVTEISNGSVSNVYSYNPFLKAWVPTSFEHDPEVTLSYGDISKKFNINSFDKNVKIGDEVEVKIYEKYDENVKLLENGILYIVDNSEKENN